VPEVLALHALSALDGPMRPVPRVWLCRSRGASMTPRLLELTEALRKAVK
jgi:hypothetical protein